MEKTGTGPGLTLLQSEPTPLSPSKSSAFFPTRLDPIGTTQQTADVPSSDSSITSCCGGYLRKGNRALKLACKRWDCPKCTKIKAKRVFARCKKSGNFEVLNRFLTLPFKIGEDRSWQEAIEQSGNILNTFLTSLRKLGLGFKYFWVREVGKVSNMIHFHMLVSRYLPKPLLSKLWAAAGGGYVVDIGIARGGTAYLWKYLLKIPNYPTAVHSALYRKKRFGTSVRLLAPLVILVTEWKNSHYVCKLVGNVIFRKWKENSDGVLVDLSQESGY